MISDRKQWLQKRGVLLGTTLVALAVGSSAIAVWAMYRLPSPEHAQGRDLLRWLVTRDLEQESVGTRRALVRQLEFYLSDEPDLDRAATELTPQRQATLEANVELLLPEWITMGAERYAETTVVNREALLDSQLELAARVGELSRLWNGTSADQNPAAENPLFAMVARIDQFVEQTQDPKRAALDQYVGALKLRWFATTDLNHLSKASLAALVLCIENELRAGLQLSQESSDADPIRSRQLWKNIDIVAEVWFHRQTSIYAKIANEARTTHMNRLVADVTSWPLVQAQLASPPASSTDGASPLGLLLNNPLTRSMKQLAQAERHVDRWIGRAPKSKQQEMRTFVADARSALRKQYLRELMQPTAER